MAAGGLLLFANAVSAATPETKLLSEMKAACGGSAWDRVRSWHETSFADIKGLPPLRNNVWHDMRSLKSVMTSTANGRIMRRTGFNGNVAWRAGPDGQVRISSDKAELRRQRRDAYLSSFGWFFPAWFPATFKRVVDVRRNGETFAVLRIAPEDAESFDLWIDPATRRIRRIEAGSEYAELSDYKMFRGVCTATVGQQGDGRAGGEMTLHVLDVQTARPATSTIFDPPIR